MTAFTLFAAADCPPHPFQRKDRVDSRVRFLVDLPAVNRMPDSWQLATTAEGLLVEIRRTDCGASCRCAGEFRLLDRTNLPDLHRQDAATARGRAVIEAFRDASSDDQDDVTFAADLVGDMLVALSADFDFKELALGMARAWEKCATLAFDPNPNTNTV